MDKVQRLWGVSFSDARDALERFAAAVGPGVATMDSESLVRGLALGELEATPEVRRQLLETFSQGEAEAGEITYREWVAGARTQLFFFLSRVATTREQTRVAFRGVVGWRRVRG